MNWLGSDMQTPSVLNAHTSTWDWLLLGWDFHCVRGFLHIVEGFVKCSTAGHFLKLCSSAGGARLARLSLQPVPSWCQLRLMGQNRSGWKVIYCHHQVDWSYCYDVHPVRNMNENHTPASCQLYGETLQHSPKSGDGVFRDVKMSKTKFYKNECGWKLAESREPTFLSLKPHCKNHKTFQVCFNNHYGEQ